MDDLEHCRNAGEIEIPLKQGTLSEDRICGELGDLILRKAAGRKSDTDITVFDSTGMALLDLAVADFLLKKNRGSQANCFHSIKSQGCSTSDKALSGKQHRSALFLPGHGILYWYCNHHGLFQKRI